MVPRSPATL